MKEANFIAYKDGSSCVVAKVVNLERFHTPTGVALEVKEARRFIKINLRFIGHENTFTKKEIEEAMKLLKNI